MPRVSHYLIHPGTHCPVIPEPTEESNFQYFKAEGDQNDLELLSGGFRTSETWSFQNAQNSANIAEYTIFSPTLPAEVAVSYDFGRTKIFLVEGYVSETKTAPTFVILYDDAGAEVLRAIIDPVYAQVTVSSPLMPLVEQSEAVNIDLGKPVNMEINYVAAEFSFTLKVNGFDLETYLIPDNIPDIVVGKVRMEGDLIVNFAGQREPGQTQYNKSGRYRHDPWF